MNYPQLVNRLNDQHRRLRGKLAQAEKTVETLRCYVQQLADGEADVVDITETIAALETTIRLFHPSWTPTGTSIHPRKGPLRQPFGTYARVIMEILKEATAPMGASEIAREAMRRLGELDTATRDDLNQVRENVRQSLNKKPDIVEQVGKPKKFQLRRIEPLPT